MSEQQDQHDSPPGPINAPPILDYGRAPVDGPVVFGQPLGKTIRQLLVVEVILLLIASVMLDTGTMMMIVAFVFTACWLTLIVYLLATGIRPPLRQRIEILIGIVLAAAGVLMMKGVL